MDIEELTKNHIWGKAIKKWLRRPWTRPPWQSGRRKGIQTRKARRWLAIQRKMNWYQYDQESGRFIQISGGLKVPFFGVVDSE